MRGSSLAPSPIVCGHGHRASDGGDALFSLRSIATPPAARGLKAIRVFPRSDFAATVEQSVRGRGITSLCACQKLIPMSGTLFESIARKHVKARP